MLSLPIESVGIFVTSVSNLILSDMYFTNIYNQMTSSRGTNTTATLHNLFLQVLQSTEENPTNRTGYVCCRSHPDDYYPEVKDATLLIICFITLSYPWMNRVLESSPYLASRSGSCTGTEGSKLASPVARAHPRSAGARNICVGFADVTRTWRESGANLAHMSRKCYAQNSRMMRVL
jgi:hypothetical protein